MPEIKKEFSLLPYVEVDGVKSLSNTNLFLLWQKMLKDHTIESVFYDGIIRSPSDFIEFVNSPTVQLFVLSMGEDIDGICWLTPMHRGSSWIHFCMFSNCWGEKARELATWTLQELLHVKDDTGNFVLDTLVGITPANNHYASKFIFKVGMKPCGFLPGICYDYYKDKFVDGIITYINREE